MIHFILCFFILLFALVRSTFLMLFLQQKEYKNLWFLKLVFHRLQLVDKRLSALLVLCFGAMFFAVHFVWLIVPLAAWAMLKDIKQLKNMKKKLAWTVRVKRIYFLNAVLLAAILYVLWPLNVLVAMFITAQIIPLCLALANLLLAPVEFYIQHKIIQDAKHILSEMNPVVIGITGSYGKTSVKHILYHILSSQVPTLCTPGSVNTPMGICRVIRENLRPEHKFFLVEMGAYFKGSIAKLCNLANPAHGIITAVGQAHYELFKTQENVAAAKFELGEAVSQKNGILVINANQIAAKFIPQNMPLIKVGDKENYFISEVKQTPQGLQFCFHYNGKKQQIFAPVFGVHHASNIALAMAFALELKMPIASIAAALKSLPQITHRLEVKHQAPDIVLIDDAYNSNPDGFKSALELLKTLRKTRSILITPGMVELGAKHGEKHFEIGKIAGASVDICLAVNSQRIASFIDGFKQTQNGNILLEVASFAEAKKWMSENLLPQDVVLLENDLPDMFEFKFNL